MHVNLIEPIFYFIFFFPFKLFIIAFFFDRECTMSLNSNEFRKNERKKVEDENKKKKTVPITH